MKTILYIGSVIILGLLLSTRTVCTGNSPPDDPPCLAGGPVTRISHASVCQGYPWAEVSVSVTSFSNVGSLSLGLSYPAADLGTPEVIYTETALWGTFLVNLSEPGQIIASGYGSSLSLPDNTVLFTLRFTRPTGMANATVQFIENVQGTLCEYTSGDPPYYDPYCDTPAIDFYFPGSVSVTPPVPFPVPTVSDLQATGTNIQWYLSESGGSPLSGAESLVNGQHYYASQTINGVESTARLDVTAGVDATSCPPTGQPLQNLPSGATIDDLVVDGDLVRWYTAAEGGTAIQPGTLLTDNTDYWASQTVQCIESAVRLKVRVALY